MELGHEGKEVTVVDQLTFEQLRKNVNIFTEAIFNRRLDEGGVKRLCGTSVIEINDKGVLVQLPGGTEKLLEADTVITSFGLKPNAKLIEELSDVVPVTYVIGDAEKVGLIGGATNSAYRVCLDIDS